MYTTIITAAAISLIIGGSIAYEINKIKIKGFLGERKVNRKLQKLSKKNKGKVIKNLNLIKKDGISTQIDHVFVNNSGIFVVETKNYSGKLVGSEKDYNWTQVLGDKKYEAHNFARQNEGHVAAIYEFLGKNCSLPVYSVLSFNPTCETRLNLKKSIVTSYDTISDAIKFRSRKPLVSDAVVDNIYNLLNTEAIKNKSVSKTHVERLTLQQNYDKKAKRKGLSREEMDIQTARNFERMSSYSIDLSKPGKHSFEELVKDASKRTPERNSGRSSNPFYDNSR